MARSVSVIVNQDDDERVIQQIAAVLRGNNAYARQVRDFAAAVDKGRLPKGLNFQPKPGQLLICNFGLGFQVPEIVKARPVLVISPYRRVWSGLCTVVPISSVRPRETKAYHFQLPDGIVPSGKYAEAWLKGDLVQTVGAHRLDRFKRGFRDYVAPMVPDEVLRAARRCVLHAAGMDRLTSHW